MTMIVIEPDGTLTTVDATPRSYDDLNAHIGPEGPARVRLHPDNTWEAMGWVNDCGKLFPEKYPFNLVGSIMLATMGASHQSYYGRIVLTGWQSVDRYGDGDMIPLSTRTLAAIRCQHHDTRVALGDIDCVLIGAAPDGWRETLRQYAEALRAAPAPRITIRPATDDERRRLGLQP